jgi:hypothetical protein
MGPTSARARATVKARRAGEEKRRAGALEVVIRLMGGCEKSES